jgi:hypothetical protein
MKQYLSSDLKPGTFSDDPGPNRVDPGPGPRTDRDKLARIISDFYSYEAPGRLCLSKADYLAADAAIAFFERTKP